MSVLQHQILTDKKVGEWLAAAAEEDLNDVEQANLREMTRHYQQATLLPESLVEAKSLAGSRCEHAWRTQRPANDWQGFSANLKEVVKLSREEARLRAEAKGCTPYDALLDIFEPDMSSARLDVLFGDLKSWLPELLAKVVEKQVQRSFVPPQGPFPTATQRELGLEAMKMLGFDFNGGRLDVSAHPFCGGVPEDVRITTRYDEDELLSALFGVIHETGHARYEQNLPRAWAGQPVALARSTAIHESQSLFFEMQLGRSEAFLKHLLPAVHARFGSQAAFSEENFIAWNQRVKPGYIRVDADEVSYPAHVVLRYEIERALINGEIEVDDIPRYGMRKCRPGLDYPPKITTATAVCRTSTGPTAVLATSRLTRWGQCMRHSCSMPPKLRCPGCRHPLPEATSRRCLTGCVRISGSTAAVSARRSSSPRPQVKI